MQRLHRRLLVGPGRPAEDEWLHEGVEKNVVSTTLEETPCLFRDARTAVETLTAEPGRDVLVLNSATLMQSLLRDDLRLAVIPVLLGGGLRLLPDGVASRWTLVSSTTLPDGAIGVHHRRAA